MKLDKYDRMFIAFMFVIVTIFSIGFCFAVEGEENVNFSTVSGIVVGQNQNFFSSDPAQNVGYFYLEKGYKYIISNNSQYSRYLCVCNDVPSLNGTYDFLSGLDSGSSYEYISNGGYLVFAFSNVPATSVKRVKLANMDGAVGDLVSNVGVNQLWGVFENGIDFVGVIVLVAFGLFLVFLLIKKVSKGKSDF